MALADYRLCDVCEGKAFYDANLNYDIGRRGPDGKWVKPENAFRMAGQESAGNPSLDYLGDWAVLCADCAKTHKCVILPLSPASIAPTGEVK